MKYVGYLTDDNAGFYRSSYINENNDTVWLMTSQLESTDARKSFPCFDEPAMKAQFTIRAIHQNNYTALSNMPEEQRVAV
jgi:aminopeptidase N